MDTNFWFSQEEPEWIPHQLINGRTVFKATGNYTMKDWDRCSISAIKIRDKKINVFVRKKTTQFSSYRQKDINIVYMFSFETLQLNKPLSEYYKLSNPKTNDKNKGKRLVLSFKKNNLSLAQGRECYIWN